jgi:2-polyprenyl-6-methoxyphenol hydroxylase-like FAD-dependent oxidoreductase
MTARPDLVVVGAGPTGLTLALQARAHGATVRVVERRPDALRPSRAMIMHSRTLETLRPFGVTGQLLDRADRSPRADLHVGRSRVPVRLGNLELPDTAFPHLTLVRQMDVEEVLVRALEDTGVVVERGTSLVAAAADSTGGVRATLRSAAGMEEVLPRFLAGCDGASSTVRHLAHLGWRGGAYHEEVVLADVELDGDLAADVLHVGVGRDGIVFVFALGEGAHWRVLATRPCPAGRAESGQPEGEASVSVVQRLLDVAGLGVTIVEMRWSAWVRLEHRLARSYRRGPIFLAGDAAHAWSPATGQGMNTGIMDAGNLGWKVAFASQQATDTGLMDTYERERRPVARRVLALTHLAFFGEASPSTVARVGRGTLLPLAAPAIAAVANSPRLMAGLSGLLAQRWVHYRRSPLSRDGTPTLGRWPRPGDWLPDREVTSERRCVRLHDLTSRPGVHVLLERAADQLDERSLGPRVLLHRIDNHPGRGLVAVRPDGYVGFRCGQVDARQLRAWLDVVGAS